MTVNVPPTGTDLIAAERARQVETKGYTADHDQAHCLGDPSPLARAAVAYVVRTRGWWPWHDTEPKLTPHPPTAGDRVRELTKAGALIAAEIDRLNTSTGQPS